MDICPGCGGPAHDEELEELVLVGMIPIEGGMEFIFRRESEVSSFDPGGIVRSESTDLLRLEDL